MTYHPRDEQDAILDRAYDLIQSVPYKVSARWLFYALLQEGTYPGKESYRTKLLPLLAKARKTFHKQWRPDTLMDDTREAIIRGDGFDDVDEWLAAVGRAKCSLDKWVGQDVYLELWFEAKAMRGQFEYYTDYITLRPFGGDPSIAYKWSIAKDLEKAAETYDNPITIVYFGDLDPKGLTIPESAIRDIREWCSADFTFIRGGLNPGDDDKYNIAENPDKPGTFQWEALNDEIARELITSIIGEYISLGSFTETVEEERNATISFQNNWKEFTNG